MRIQSASSTNGFTDHIAVLSCSSFWWQQHDPLNLFTPRKLKQKDSENFENSALAAYKEEGEQIEKVNESQRQLLSI